MPVPPPPAPPVATLEEPGLPAPPPPPPMHSTSTEWTLAGQVQLPEPVSVSVGMVLPASLDDAVERGTATAAGCQGPRQVVGGSVLNTGPHVTHVRIDL